MTIPYPKTAQFMSATVGRGPTGKKQNTQAKKRKSTAMMLIGRPSLPRSNLDGKSGSPRIRFNAIHEIEIMYEVSIEATPRETTCMNATVEPRLMNERITTNTSVM
jgi:hypothetical protein